MRLKQHSKLHQWHLFKLIILMRIDWSLCVWLNDVGAKSDCVVLHKTELCNAVLVSWWRCIDVKIASAEDGTICTRTHKQKSVSRAESSCIFWTAWMKYCYVLSGSYEWFLSIQKTSLSVRSLSNIWQNTWRLIRCFRKVECSCCLSSILTTFRCSC